MQLKLVNKDTIIKYELHPSIIELTKNTKNKNKKLVKTEIKIIKYK